MHYSFVTLRRKARGYAYWHHSCGGEERFRGRHTHEDVQAIIGHLRRALRIAPQGPTTITTGLAAEKKLAREYLEDIASATER